MGEELYNSSDRAKQIFYEASEVMGVDIAEACFGSETDRLDETLVAQPAIAAVSVAEGLHLRDLGIKFDAGIGHSMGEIPLLAVAGSLAVKDTFELIRVRAEATSKANQERPGGMMAINKFTREQLLERAAHIFASGRVFVANFNSKKQQVVTGDHDRIAELEELFSRIRKSEKFKVLIKKLKTGGAFHSPYHMEGAVNEFYESASRVNYSRPDFEVMLNNGHYLDEVGTEHLAHYLSHQLVKEVDFERSAGRLIADGVRNFIEVGPRRHDAKYKTLSGLLKHDFADIVKIIEVSERNTETTNNKK